MTPASVPRRPQRRPPFRLFIARGDQIRSVAIRPRLLVASLVVAGVLVTGGIASVAYLVYRDDIVGSTLTLHTQVSASYEQRIAELRAQVERVTTEQLVAQAAFDDKIDELLQRQETIDDRQQQIAALIERAREQGLEVAAVAPALPLPNPLRQPSALAAAGSAPAPTQSGAAPVVVPWTAFAEEGGPADASPWDVLAASGLRGSADVIESPASAAEVPEPELLTPAVLETGFSQLDDAIDRMTVEHAAAARAIALEAQLRISSIEAIADEFGIPVRVDSAVGGPFVPTDPDRPAYDLDQEVASAELAMARLDALRQDIRELPLGAPVPGAQITSGFGTRADPFIGASAVHEGIDFRAATGFPVHATGPGTVVFAGWSNGYGEMVEIDHGGGLSTRYGHMSRIDVAVGDHVAASDVVGLAGSTGRSTGPHVHYETRIGGVAVNPLRFLTAGERIGAVLSLAG